MTEQEKGQAARRYATHCFSTGYTVAVDALRAMAESGGLSQVDGETASLMLLHKLETSLDRFVDFWIWGKEDEQS